MKKWQCVVCGFIYDEAEGWPDDGIAPGTRWEDVPEDWVCPGLWRRQDGLRNDRHLLISDYQPSEDTS